MANQSEKVKELEKKLWEGLNLVRGDLMPGDYSAFLFLVLIKYAGFHEQLDLGPRLAHREELGSICLELEETCDSPFQSLCSVFEPVLQKLSEETWIQVSGLLLGLDIVVLMDNFPQIFNNLLNDLSRNLGFFSGESILETSIADLIFEITDVSPFATVYNPFAGTATLGSNIDRYQRYYGQEISPRSWAIGFMRLFANGRKPCRNPNHHTIYSMGDSVKNWNPWDLKFDLIVAAPPFGQKLEKRNQGGSEDAFSTIDQFFIYKGLQSLSTEGKLIGIVPQGFLFSSAKSAMKLKRDLIESGKLEAIISFPGGFVIGSGVAVAIVIINNQPEEKRKIRLFDAFRFLSFSSKRTTIDTKALVAEYQNASETNSQLFVDTETIVQNNFDLSVGRYFLKEKVGAKLSGLGKVIVGKKPESNEQVGPVVKIGNLQDDPTNSDLDLRKVPDQALLPFFRKIEESCVLLATRWNSLKPTFFKYTGSPIYISKDITAFVPNKDQIICEFLILGLHEEHVVRQLQALRVGSVVPNLRSSDLLNIHLLVPTIEEQQARIQESFKKAVVENNQLAEIRVADISLSASEQNAFLRHSLAGPVSGLSYTVDALVTFINEQIVQIVPDLLSRKISSQHTFTIGDHLEQLQRNSKKIHELVKRNLKEDLDFSDYQFSQISILAFLKKYAEGLKDRVGSRYRVLFDFDKEAFTNSEGNLVDIQIFGNEDLLTLMLDNLAENAEKHAFPGEKIKEFEIHLMAPKSKGESPTITIEVSNTGKLFPKDLTFKNFITKGRSFGPTEGTGLGGWMINRIVHAHNGEFGLIDETGPEGLQEPFLATTFYIDLPISEIKSNEKI